MRMRKKKNGDERLKACQQLLLEKPETPMTNIHAKTYLEIGCGKGDFACQMAKSNPDTLFLAMEKVKDVMIIASEKGMASLEERPSDNLRFILGNADELETWFMPESFDKIFLNFSDPWPKKGHAKRRLTCQKFLKIYLSLLKKGGTLQFKTDNVGLFAFTLEEVQALGLTLACQTDNLHQSPFCEDNVMTEYEQHFSSLGFPIHMLRLQKD